MPDCNGLIEMPPDEIVWEELWDGWVLAVIECTEANHHAFIRNANDPQGRIVVAPEVYPSTGQARAMVRRWWFYETEEHRT